MVSLIICSKNSDLSLDLKKSILLTIGIDYELIVIDNSKNKYSIFSAYNEGVKRAKYPYLCFMHDDILFHTSNWGKKILNHLNNDKIGLIGVAGSHYMPKLPGAHWSSEILSMNIIHTINGKTEKINCKFTDTNESSLPAILIDGLWFCCRKNIFEKIRFDDRTFSGFHCYDSDLCLQLKQLNYEIRIIFDINIEHFSLGVRNKIWLENIFKLYNKWKKLLPLSAMDLPKTKISCANYINSKELIEQIIINKFGYKNIIKIFLYYLKANPPINRLNLVYLYMLLSTLTNKKISN